jgi:hypothetical protein
MLVGRTTYTIRWFRELKLQFDEKRVSLLAFAAIIMILSPCGCGPAASLKPKTRPQGVPATALWAGGADGGAYVLCSVDTARNVNPCSVWNDYTGDLVESGNYRLSKKGRAATQSELQISFPDFNGLIYLNGGLVLKHM